MIIAELCMRFCVMFQDGKLYHGPCARRVIITSKDYDETKEISPPNFDNDSECVWKCAFVQARSSIRVLKANTLFLYCKLYQHENM